MATGFYENMGKGVLIKEDEDYLQELQKWHKNEIDRDETAI